MAMSPSSTKRQHPPEDALMCVKRWLQRQHRGAFSLGSTESLRLDCPTSTQIGRVCVQGACPQDNADPNPSPELSEKRVQTGQRDPQGPGPDRIFSCKSTLNRRSSSRSFSICERLCHPSQRAQQIARSTKSASALNALPNLFRRALLPRSS